MGEADLIILIFDHIVLGEKYQNGQPHSVWPIALRSSNVLSGFQDSGGSPVDYEAVKGKCFVKDLPAPPGEVPAPGR